MSTPHVDKACIHSIRHYLPGSETFSSVCLPLLPGSAAASWFSLCSAMCAQPRLLTVFSSSIRISISPFKTIFSWLPLCILTLQGLAGFVLILTQEKSSLSLFKELCYMRSWLQWTCDAIHEIMNGWHSLPFSDHCLCVEEIENIIAIPLPSCCQSAVWRSPAVCDKSANPYSSL